MAVRKGSLVLVFCALLTVSGFYLSSKYNADTIQYMFWGSLNQKDLEDLQAGSKNLLSRSSSNKEIPYVINYQGQFAGGRLIMTTGMDNLIRAISMKQGRWLTYGDRKEAVLGDLTADRLFRTAEVLNETVEVYGQRYKIVGVIKNSSEIYISFDEASKAAWDRKSIYFMVHDKKKQYLYKDLLEGKLKSMGLEITDIVVYRQEIAAYNNLLLIIVMIALQKLFRQQLSVVKTLALLLYEGYRLQSRQQELIKYMVCNRSAIGRFLLHLLVVILVVFAGVAVVPRISLPPELVPSNLFSLQGYIDVVKLNLQRYIDRIQYGLSGILLEAHIINLILLLCFGIAAAVYKKPSVRKN